jgi:hypothetical protein
MIERLIALVVGGTVRGRAVRDAVTGDLLEEYDVLRSTRGRFAAALWAIRQLLLSFPFLAGIGPADCEYTIGLVARFYGKLAALVALSVAVVMWLARGMTTIVSSPSNLAYALVASVVSCVLAGIAAAFFTPRAPLAASVAVGVLCTGIGVAALLSREVAAPTPYWSLVLFLMMPAAACGGLLRVHALLRREPPTLGPTTSHQE